MSTGNDFTTEDGKPILVLLAPQDHTVEEFLWSACGHMKEFADTTYFMHKPIECMKLYIKGAQARVAYETHLQMSEFHDEPLVHDEPLAALDEAFQEMCAVIDGHDSLEVFDNAEANAWMILGAKP